MRIVAIARELGISTTTVSRSLSGQGRVSTKTRQRVMDAARRLGYVPNFHAQGLATGRSGVVLLHATDVDAEFMLEMVRGIWPALHQHGYRLVLDAAGILGVGSAVLDEWSKAHAVDGAIVISGAPTHSNLGDLGEAEVPVVTVGYSWALDMPSVGSVIWNLQTGAAQVAEALTGLGHRRIGFINIAGPDLLVSHFRDALRQRGVALRDDHVVVAQGLTPDDGAAALRELLSRRVAPTAVLVRNDILALGALLEAQRQGLRVPDDLSVVGHDDLPIARYSAPPLTTVHVDCPTIGRAAAEMLLDLISRSDSPPETTPTRVMDCLSLLVRESIGPAPKRKERKRS